MTKYLKSKYTRLTIGLGLALAPLASFAAVTPDPDVATTVNTIGETFKVNALSMLNTAIPWVVGLIIVFLAYKFIVRKMKGAAR
jgi:hypothetical protein